MDYAGESGKGAVLGLVRTLRTYKNLTTQMYRRYHECFELVKKIVAEQLLRVFK